MQVDLREFRAAYLAEVDEHLGAVSELLLAVEARTRENKPSPREHRDLMRLLHTIKGLSAMVGIEPIVTLAHHMENALRSADTASNVVSERVLEALIAATRAIESRVRAVASGKEVTLPDPATLATLDAANRGARAPSQPPPADADADAPALDPELAAKLTPAEHSQLADATASGKRALRIDFAPSPAKAEKGKNITSVRETLSAFGELVRVLPIARPSSEGTPGGLVFAIVLTTTAPSIDIADALGIGEAEIHEVIAARALPVASAGPEPVADEPIHDVQRSGVLRVEVTRIDDAIEQLSSLIVTRSRLAIAVAKLREAGVDTRELEIIMADNARQLRDLRGAMLRVRMVPIDSVLDRLPLVIRGLGKSTGKQVRLALQGGGAELDKTVAERIFPALVHLLRNAVDHGIESREERARAGKPEQATVVVSSSSRNNRQIEIRVADDGRGVDRVAVAAKAKRTDPVDDATLLDLLCRPGFSTRDAVDTTSGRGVGMDVVKKIIDGLGGELALETTAGQGTTFILRVPLTIAIVDAFSLRCAGDRYVVPVPVVEEILEIDHAKVIRGPRVRDEETRFFARRGETVPLVDLSRALGNKSDHENSNVALVVRRGHDEPVAFAIDRILGRQETVIRPLADPLVMVAGVSGSTDLGDGRVTLVLDLLALSSRLTRQERAA